jgi:hypothetical protein
MTDIYSSVGLDGSADLKHLSKSDWHIVTCIRHDSDMTDSHIHGLVLRPTGESPGQFRRHGTFAIKYSDYEMLLALRRDGTDWVEPAVLKVPATTITTATITTGKPLRCHLFSRSLPRPTRGSEPDSASASRLPPRNRWFTRPAGRTAVRVTTKLGSLLGLTLLQACCSGTAEVSITRRPVASAVQDRLLIYLSR